MGQKAAVGARIGEQRCRTQRYVGGVRCGQHRWAQFSPQPPARAAAERLVDKWRGLERDSLICRRTGHRSLMHVCFCRLQAWVQGARPFSAAAADDVYDLVVVGGGPGGYVRVGEAGSGVGGALTQTTGPYLSSGTE